MFAKTMLTIFLLITCYLTVSGELILHHDTEDNPKVCSIRTPCIKKCCPENYILKKQNCTYAPTSKLEFKVYDVQEQVNDTVEFNVIHNRDCTPEQNLRLEAEFEEDTYYIQKNGTILKPFDESFPRISYSHYCLDNIERKGKTEFAVIVCYDADNLEDTVSRQTNSLGMIISMPFLLATFLVYLILPERNLHRKALMSYVFTLLAAYITLVTIQMYPYQFKPVPCQILGYCIIFFFLVSFFWMNVMCIDMWLAFSGMRTVMSKKYAERKRFIIYCIYAWGTPIIHVGIVLLLNTHSPPDADYYPKIGDPRCFLGDGMPTFYYFYLPMAIIIGINIVFFILTTVRIQQIKKETSMLKQTESKKSYEDDKQKFNLYLKLMFAMGINWIMELISWTVEKLLRDTPTFIWYLSDFTNAMYGVLIFVIFVFKKKIWQSLKKRYYVFIGKPHLAHSFTTSSARGTRASNYSTTDTAVSTDYRLNDMKRIPEESALNRT
ncbi:G-protein coupled receptor Mth2-like isoform X4 [Diorhabda carinulata]|uniref:G-protein coupled receptor Mth2-like isoform X4 n=1 Tax=Diorhabda carinulata TaxID=1163345 RepID=UPI0025A2FE52|nr:G-protein coupled receptor Mth2-like isoform X4 [Diorhabda carinulata]